MTLKSDVQSRNLSLNDFYLKSSPDNHLVNQYNFARQTVCLECPFSAFIFCLFFFPSGNFQKCVSRDASYSLKVAAQTKQHRGVNAFIHAFVFVLTSFHQYVQCPATEHHREYHGHQNPYQR